ncbi:General transcription factor IIE subunit 1 [Heterocephalus glaber]|uniref:General transcription factor IIE subunit 1 n=1 Tax=Heterocephalus glaber TaxID=10181 RepID=G5C9U7_HETGA|nr:General transcription factor IIE subunit 1 [Heterocephalus glaber]
MDDQEDVHRASLEGKSAKERPIWLRESTVQGAYSSKEMKEGGIDMDAFQEHEEGHAGPDGNEEVIDSESETSESDDDSPPRPAAAVAMHHQEEDEEDDNEFEEVADDPTVMVAGHPFSYSEVNQRLVAQLTPEEKEAYIAMGQCMFEHLFE